MRADEVRLEELICAHRAAVFSHAVVLTGGDASWAEDIVQETFLRAWRHWEQMNPERGSVRGWLLRVAHNLVVDGFRSARMRHGEVPLDEAGELAVPEPADQVVAAAVVRDALAGLPVPQRQALEATFLKDQTVTQAARQLNVPVGTVKSRVFYGLRMLRQAV
jgi:RNA polymerase sigma-70 factor, ECF subfamily